MNKTSKLTKLDIFGIIWTSIVVIVTVLDNISEIMSNLNNAIVVFNVLIGSIYLILRKITKKENVIIKNKFDIAIHLFYITMYLPIIFNTYITLQGTIEKIIIYTQALIFYNVVKNLCENDICKKIVLSSFLFSTMIVLLYGIESYTYEKINKFLDIGNFLQNSKRELFSFNYPYHNILAAVMLAGIYVSRYLYKESKLKLIYLVMLLLNCIGFILAYSRTAIVLFGLIEGINLVINIKTKSSNKDIVNLIVCVLVACLFRTIFIKVDTFENALNVWLIFLVSIISVAIYYFLTRKFEFKIQLKLNKKVIISTVVFVGVFVIIIFNVSGSIKINSDNEDEIMNREYAINSLKPGKSYNVKVNYETTGESIYMLEFCGITNNGDYARIYGLVLDNSNNTKEFEIYIDEEYASVKLQLANIHWEKGTLEIKDIYVNGKRDIVNYKFIPYSISYIIKNLNLTNVSMNERLNIYKDCLKISFYNKFIGLGGEVWQKTFQIYKTYGYYTTEVHSRIFEVLISYGIIGLIMYFLSIINFIFYYKNYKNERLIFSAISIMFIHSLTDWIFSRKVGLLIFMLLIGIIASKFKEEKEYKILDRLYLSIISIIVIFTSIVHIQAYYEYKNNNLDGYIFSDSYMIFNSEYNNLKLNKMLTDENPNKEEIKKLFERILKFEKINYNNSNLINYIKFCDENNFEYNEKLVLNSIRNSFPYDSFSIVVVTEYIESLFEIKKCLPQFEDIIQEKIEEAYEKIIKKVNNHKENLLFNNNYTIMNNNDVSDVQEKLNNIYKKIYLE